MNGTEQDDRSQVTGVEQAPGVDAAGKVGRKPAARALAASGRGLTLRCCT